MMPSLEKMRHADAMWLNDTPENLMIINGVFLTEKLTAAEFKQVFQEKILDAGEGKQYDRFKKQVVWRSNKPHWEFDPNFDIDQHIVAHSDSSIQTEDDLATFIGQEASKPLDDTRSRWKIQVLEDFDGGSAILVRIHHVLADGIALVPILFALIEEAEAHHKPRDVSKPKGHAFVRFVVAPLLAIPVLVSKLLWIPDKSVLHGAPLSGAKQVAWTPHLDMEDVKLIKNHFRATVNDVLMSCVAGAIRRYKHEKQGFFAPKIRTSMPFNIRAMNEPIKMENKFAVALVELPLVEGVHPQLKAIKTKMDAIKRSVQPLILYKTVEIVLALFPPKLSGTILNLFGNKCSTVTTNVPGPQGELSMAGKKVKSILFWVPTRATIGIGISILSLSGSVRIGILGDSAVMPDPNIWIEKFMEEFEEMKAASSND